MSMMKILRESPRKTKRYNNVIDENSQRENPKGINYHLSVDAKDSFQIEDIQSLVWEANLSCNLTQTSETVRSLTQSMPDQVNRQTNKGVNTHIRVLQVSLHNILLQNLQTLLWTVLQLKLKIIVWDQVTAPLHTHNLNTQVTAPLYAQFECSCLNKKKKKCVSIIWPPRILFCKIHLLHADHYPEIPKLLKICTKM